MAHAAPGVTADRILDLAQRLVQTRGFNAFSYADLSVELGIRKASIHHHFPTKAELGRRLMSRYRDTFLGVLAAIDRESPRSADKLKRYVGLYRDVLRNEDRMCLCGMLAADFKTLPKTLRDAVQDFFNANERWLTDLLEKGRKGRELHFEGSPATQARLLVSGLEGAMLVARTYGDLSRFEDVASGLLSRLLPPGSSRRRS
jgi:TetR/AcrR family transcriptional repressor of nem operon